MQGSSVRGFKILVRRSKTRFGDGSLFVSGEVDGRSVKRWWTEEKVSTLFENQNCPEKILYFRAIQAHLGEAYSGNARINRALHDNVLLPNDFTKYVYHVGNGKEMRSIVRDGLVPGGFSTKTERHAVFFTVVNPMDDEHGFWETFLRIITSKNRALQEYLETTSGHGMLVQFIARSRRRTAILPNKSNGVVLLTHCLQSSLRKRCA